MEHAALIGLEVKERWARALLDGGKTVELRSYALPAACRDRPVLLLATPDGSEGRSTLPDELPAGHEGAWVAGSVRFSAQTVYRSAEELARDAAAHCVPAGSPYGWQPGVTQALYGWHVSRVEPLPPGAPRQPVPAMRRVHRSWFALASEGGGEAASDRAAAGGPAAR